MRNFLLLITIFLLIFSESISSSGVVTGDVEKRKKDIQLIMKDSLRKVFKIPGGVKFKNVKFKYKKIFESAGIVLSEPTQEKELVQMCGYFSAQNELGINSLFQPFFIQIGINNKKKGLSGDVLYKFDNKYKKLISMNSKFSMDSSKEEFEVLWNKLCGNLDEQYLGVLSGYKFGYDAIGYSELDKKLQQLSHHKFALSYFSVCNKAEENIHGCLFLAQCKIKNISSELTKKCQLVNELCDQDPAKVCFYKIEKNNKEKKTASLNHPTKLGAELLEQIYISIEPPFIINFKGEQKAKYFQVGVTISTKYNLVMEAVKKNMPAIRNKLTFILASQEFTETLTNSGKLELKEQLKKSINKVLSKKNFNHGISKVYFTSFVAQ